MSTAGAPLYRKTAESDKTPQIGVLVSGAGTNLQALIDAVSRSRLDAAIAGVVSDRPGARAIQRAVSAGIPTATCDRKSLGRDLSAEILDVLGPDLDLIVLAGFLSKVEPPLLDAYEGKMINIHPALLPEFGGPGMYGRHVHEAVLAAGHTETGCTVHYVTDEVDAGEIILQKRIDVHANETPDTLAARLRPLEHEALVEAVALLTKGEPAT